MPTDDWACAQALLRSWPTMPVGFQATGTCRRLQDALAVSAGAESGWPDLAGLIRQALLEHEARQGVRIPLRVPGTPPFPTREQWHWVGCDAVADGSMFSVTATPWHPP